MKKYIFLMLFSLSACTYSLNVAQSEGDSKGLIQEDQKPTLDLQLDGNIPL